MNGTDAPKGELSDDVKEWARDLVTAVGKRKARTIRDDYALISKNRRSTKSDRELAHMRVQALSLYV